MKLKDTADQHAKQQQQKAEQARINGAKSKGPTSPEGKSKSSRNAIRHGLTANEHTLLESEFPEEYAEVRAAFIDDLRPATKAELRLVEKIANLDWRLERFVMMETALLNITADTNLKEITDHFTRIDGIGIIVEAWKKDHSTTLCLDLLRRYMARSSTSSTRPSPTSATLKKPASPKPDKAPTSTKPGARPTRSQRSTRS